MHPEEYVLYVSLSTQEPKPTVDWHQLARQFNLKLVRERSTQATVEASGEEIDRLRKACPTIEVTRRKKYNTISPRAAAFYT